MVWHGSWRVIAFPLFLLISGVGTYLASSPVGVPRPLLITPTALGIVTIVMGQVSAAPSKLSICTRAYFLITLATNVLATSEALVIASSGAPSDP